VSSPTKIVSAVDRSAVVSWRSAIAWAVVLGLAAHLALFAIRSDPKTTPVVHSHTNVSLILAMNWVICGKYSFWSPNHGPTLSTLLETESTLDTQIAALPAMVAGSGEAYCESLSTGYVNAENSLMLLDAVYLRIFPGGTIRGLDVDLRRLQALLVLPFVVVALRGGGSLALAFGLWVASLLTISLMNDAISCSSYGFLGPGLLLLASAVAAANDEVSRRRAPAAIVAGLLVGSSCGFVGNLRTSYLPIIVAILATAAACMLRRLGRAATTRLLALACGIALGWWSFHLEFISPLAGLATSSYSSPEHHFFHPLVLGLANPPNRLASEEGISWNDGAGLALAVRADPSLAGVNSLWSIPVATYEAALRKYYLQLWRQRPRDMLELYWLKWMSSTREVFTFIASNVPEPFRLLSSGVRPILGIGVTFTAVFLVIGLVAVMCSRSWNLAASTLVATACACLLLLGFESTAILSGFYLSHQSALLLLILMAELAGLQVGIDVVAALSRRIAGRVR